MPPNLDPNRQSGKQGSTVSFHDVDYDQDYDYPGGRNFSPGSDLHDTIVDEVMQRANESYEYMSQHHDDWREVDNVLRSYVRPERRDAKKNRSDEDKQGTEKDRRYKELVMPYSFANLETLLTYMTTAFLKDPVFEYKGVSPNDTKGAMLMQEVINLHVRRNHVGLNLHTMWRDAFAYGVGPVSPRWGRKFGKKTLKKELGVFDRLRNMFIKQGEEKTTSDRELIFEGNKLENIDPYKYLPDPNASLHEVQEAQWQGWVDRTNYMRLLGREEDGESMLFNVKYLQHFDPRSSLMMTKGERRNRDDAKEPSRSTASKNDPVDVIWMYVDLIPEKWELGEKEYPEKWVFGVAGEEVVIAAKPMGLTHGEFPIANAVPDYDGHSVSPVSRMGMINDMQTLVDFLFTSHIQNVRKAINNQFVIDPTKVNIFDARDPKPGNLIRTRRASFGGNAVEEGIKQLDVRDVTQSNIQDAQILQNVMQQTTGASDSLQGRIPSRTTRVSASEIQGTRQSGLSRLERVANIISMQAMQPIGYQFAHLAQQFMEQEQFVEVTGDLRDRLEDEFNVNVNRGRVNVNPFDILVDYDIIPNDGSIPGQQDGRLWVELYQILAQNPKVAQNFDMIRIFKHTARQLGADNVDDFELGEEQAGQVAPEPEVMDDQQVQEEIRKGNLVPAPGGDGQPARQESGGPPAGARR